MFTEHTYTTLMEFWKKENDPSNKVQPEELSTLRIDLPSLPGKPRKDATTIEESVRRYDQAGNLMETERQAIYKDGKISKIITITEFTWNE